jgi:hypothetical protein
MDSYTYENPHNHFKTGTTHLVQRHYSRASLAGVMRISHLLRAGGACETCRGGGGNSACGVAPAVTV